MATSATALPTPQDLVGRIDAIAQAYLCLATELDARQVIDGPALCQRLRSFRSAAGGGSAVVSASQRVLAELADALDAARAARQSRGD